MKVWNTWNLHFRQEPQFSKSMEIGKNINGWKDVHLGHFGIWNYSNLRKSWILHIISGNTPLRIWKIMTKIWENIKKIWKRFETIWKIRENMKNMKIFEQSVKMRKGIKVPNYKKKRVKARENMKFSRLKTRYVFGLLIL